MGFHRIRRARHRATPAALNTHLVVNTPDNRMITCFYGEIDPATGRLIYVNAGHNPPYLCDGRTPDAGSHSRRARDDRRHAVPGSLRRVARRLAAAALH